MAADPPAAQLEGMSLEGDWVVEKRLDPGPSATGGNFSVGYIARHPDHGPAFLKALDYSRAFRSSDVPRALQTMTEAFNYECRVLDKCGAARMSRIVRALGRGDIHLPGAPVPVSYLLFEHADGDVRAHLDAAASFDVAWALRCIHHVAVGLNQLHGNRIAHQDLKPSNVLIFERDSSKIGDLGRADYQGHTAPWEHLDFAGDPVYAPPEQRYGHVEPDWNARRQACDVYHLGSFALFLFTGMSTTPAILSKLDPAQRPERWRGGFPAVLPFVRDAFDLVATEFESYVSGSLASDLVATYRELSDPDPAVRGHPKARVTHGNPYSLERYVSRFNLLAQRAEAGMLGANGR